MKEKHPLWNQPEDIINLAEKPEQPPLPKGGIPKQWVPGWIRWPIRVIFLPFVLLDLLAQRIAGFFFKTPYRQEGKCYQRGNCCYYIIMPAPKGFLTKLYYFWNTQINGFYPRHPQPIEVEGEELMVMGCRYLQKNGSCGQYRLRPQVCRQYPFIEYFGVPRILKGCGFYAVPRDKNFDPYPDDKNLPKNKLNIIK